MNALARLISPAAVGEMAQQGFEAGRKVHKERRIENALAAYAKNPDDDAAISELMVLDPERGELLMKHRRERQFNAAAVDYYRGGQPNALAAGVRGGPASAPPVANALRGGALQSAPPPQGSPALPPVQAGQSSNEAFAPVAAPAQAPTEAPPQRQDPDFRVLGEPADGRDAAFLKMLQVDAKRAFEIDSNMRDRAADRLKLQRDAYGFAVSRLGGVSDDASYQAALADIAGRIEPLGVEITDHLPASFPGSDGIKQLRLGAIDAKDQVSLFLQEANIEADNERADRNTDSLIDNRDARLAEQRRATDARLATTRRGQDLTDSRGRRGQDMQRDRPRGGKTRPTATDAKGRKVEWNGKSWVPVK